MSTSMLQRSDGYEVFSAGGATELRLACGPGTGKGRAELLPARGGVGRAVKRIFESYAAHLTVGQGAGTDAACARAGRSRGEGAGSAGARSLELRHLRRW